MTLKRVVITGLGALTPIGNTLQAYWANLCQGTSGCDTIKAFDASKFKTTIACELKDFKPENFFDRKEQKKLDLYAQYALIAAHEAVEDAHLQGLDINKERIGVVWGSGIGGIQTFGEEAKNYYTNGENPRFNPFFIPKMISDIAAGQISMRYGFQGPNYTTCSACASATHALIDAFNLIRLGKADIIVSGGSEAAICPEGVGGFSAMQALSTRNNDPKTASRPFDVGRDGFVIGEGAGALVLEELEHAKARGAKIYAELIGGGMSADAHHLTAPHPEGVGASNVMKFALQDLTTRIDLAPYVGYINVHGTSTPLGDVAEVKAIERVFGEQANKINISSTKSMTGHLLGAAGAIESIAAIMAIVDGVIPPTINLEERDPQINPSLNLTPNTAQKRDVTLALSNTFGFGGHNGSVLFAKPGFIDTLHL